MQSNAIKASYINPFTIWFQLMRTTTEMLWASSQVITHRTHRIIAGNVNPNLRDRQELLLMGQEKIEAATESARAVGAYMARWHAQFGMLAFNQMMATATAFASLATSRSAAQVLQHQAKLTREIVTAPAATASRLIDSAAHLTHHAIKPLHTRATKNAKRLGKR